MMSAETTESGKVEAAGERNSPAPDETRRLLEEEFNVQRAKMKELFLQKEDDMRKMIQDKEQLESEVLGLRSELQQLQNLTQNQKSEIQSLQLLVSETLEASSSSTDELRRLRSRNLELEQQLSQIRQQQEVSLAPATFVRSLARKLGADPEEVPPRKNVQEDELIHSIVKPMECEIKALKKKLRHTDAELTEAKKALMKVNITNDCGQDRGDRAETTVLDPNDGEQTNKEQPTKKCDMCENYERQLVVEQNWVEESKDIIQMKTQALRQATDELEGVRSIHDETVRAWHAERQALAQQLEALQQAVQQAQTALDGQAQAAAAAAQRALHTVTTLTVDRETLQKKLDCLERDNAMLVGQYTKKAAEMQNEVINLPNDVAELQEANLQLREQLIFCQIGREEAVTAEQELRTQLLEQSTLFHHQEAELANLRQQLKEAKDEVDRLQTEHEQMKELGDKLRHSNDMIEQLLEDKKRLQGDVHEVRARVSVLQQELDNSEKVQQDFVRLSQSLQVQLQRIREADTEVRWQHDDDVHECSACRAPLQHNKKKVHCRHCGRIFCSACVCHAVAAGPRRVPARVCSVCRTLLLPHAAPYFSTEPPRTLD